MDEIIPCVNPSATSYFLRFLFQNIMKMTIDMTFFIDICKANGEYEKVKEQMKEDFIQMIESQKKKKLTDQQRKEKIEEFVEKMKNIRLDDVINIDCLMNTIINGATFSSILTFFFLILFIVFFFVKL